MRIAWNAAEEAFAVTGSRKGAIDTCEKLWIEPENRTPATRKFVIALVDLMRERRQNEQTTAGDPS